MDFLSKISVICFTGSYFVVLVVELFKLLRQCDQSNFRACWLLQVGFTVAGLFAHSVYLLYQGGLVFERNQLFWIHNWYGWCLLGSLIMALAYFWLSLRQSQTQLGLFLLPAILATIGVGYVFGSYTSFSDRHVRSIWNWIHGFSLLLGTVIVALGSVFGLVYLTQAHRLKRKLTNPRWLRLPSLEWLQQSAEYCLVSSAILLGIGLISGIGISRFPLVEAANGSTPENTFWLGVNWTDPVIWTSGLLFAWLMLVTGFNMLYRPARQGRKVAYLVVVSFLFLILELFVAWLVGHATDDPSQRRALRKRFFHNQTSVIGLVVVATGDEHCCRSARPGKARIGQAEDRS
jgi:hypothetical protein